MASFAEWMPEMLQRKGSAGGAAAPPEVVLEDQIAARLARMASMTAL